MKKLDITTALSYVQAVKEGNGVASTNGVKARARVMYITGLGANLQAKNQQLLEPKTDKEIGITNFESGNILAKGRNLLVIGIRILFDTTADVTVLTALWKSEAPAAFKNGELVINQDGTGDLFNGPIGPIAKYSSSIPTEDEFRAVIPFMIRENARFTFQALLAGNAAANQAYRLELDCIEFTDSTVA